MEFKMADIVFCGLVLLVGILPQTSAFLTRPSGMVLENNQFKNMVIAIHESVPEDKALIDTLKDTMTEASTYLFKATQNRAYFKEITILVPSTWSNDATYQPVTSESVNLADVIITNTVRPTRSLPHARSYGGCGKQGVHILLPVDFLTSPTTEPYNRAPGRYFIHAFAQFRWGVFQEYAEAGETEFYFSLVHGRPAAIQCNAGLRGLVMKTDKTICYSGAIDQNTGLYTTDCHWFLYPTHQAVTASIMDHQWIPTIETFCNDDAGNHATVHNYEAPSKHNRLCSHRSTWDVISNSDDFNNGKNQPISNTPASAIVPSFNIVKARSRRKRALIVIDDDINVAMLGSTTLNDTLRSNDDIYTVMARLRHESDIHDIEISTSRESNFKNVHTKTKASIDALTSNLFDHIIHVRHNCTDPPILLQQLADAGPAVSMITTNHEYCKYNGTTAHFETVGKAPGHTLLDKLRQTILHDHIHNSNVVIIQREDIALSPGDQFTDSVHLDPTVGQQTGFIFHYEMELPDISLLSPSKVLFNTNSSAASVDSETKLVKFMFRKTEVGEWKYTMKSRDTKQQYLSIIVSTTPTALKHDPIIVRTSVESMTSEYGQMALHADVTRGSRPVIGLNVTAKIETPSGSIETIQLYDNGAGADNSQHDGIYSRYFTRAATEGVYHVTANVIGHRGTVHVMEEMYHVPVDTHLEDDDPAVQRLLTKRSVEGTIQRHVPMGSVHIASPNPAIRDTIPPSRVVDLKVVRHIHYRNTLVLTWTAPGDDLDHGRVQTYKLLVGQNITDVRTILWFDTIKEHPETGNIVVDEHAATVDAAETETLLWSVPPSVSKFAFAVRGIDKAENKAALSNIATFGFTHP